MSKRNYRKFLIEKQEHLVELEERRRKNFVWESSYEKEDRMRKSERNHIFADLRTMFREKHLDPYHHFIAYVDSLRFFTEGQINPKVEKGDPWRINDVNAICTSEYFFSGDRKTVLHPFVGFCWNHFFGHGFNQKPVFVMDEQTRKGCVHLLEVIRKSDIINDENLEYTAKIKWDGRSHDPRTLISGVYGLARFRDKWINNPDFWKPEGKSSLEQFLSLVKFLLCKYPMPEFFMNAWISCSPEHQEWFVNIASGENLRTQKNLPIPITKKVAHHFMNAPANCTVFEAIRWGEIMAMGGNARVANGVLRTNLRVPCANDNEFWKTVIKFFIDNPMIDTDFYGHIYDYINHQKFIPEDGIIPQPNFSMNGRNADVLLERVERWHDDMVNRRRTIPVDKIVNWGGMGIKRFEIKGSYEGEPCLYCIEELTSNAQLAAEGHELHHCVRSYSHSCANGSISIFSLYNIMEYEKEGKKQKVYSKVLTIEIERMDKNISQVRGRLNRVAKENEKEIIRQWAGLHGLKMRYGF